MQKKQTRRENKQAISNGYLVCFVESCALPFFLGCWNNISKRSVTNFAHTLGQSCPTLGSWRTVHAGHILCGVTVVQARPHKLPPCKSPLLHYTHGQAHAGRCPPSPLNHWLQAPPTLHFAKLKGQENLYGGTIQF